MMRTAGGALQHAGVAYVDITTGEFAATELAGADIQAALRAELTRLRPAEILYPDRTGAARMACPGIRHPGPPGASSRAAARRRCCAISRPPPWMALACAACRWRCAPPAPSCST